MRGAPVGEPDRGSISLFAHRIYPKPLRTFRSDALPREHYSPVAVEHDAAFEVKSDGAGQNPAFDVTPGGNEVVSRHRMRHPFGFLLDDRSFIEIRRHVMRGRADQLHAALMRLMVGFCPL